MPEVVAEQTYTMRFSKNEYRVVTKALARVAGLLDVNTMTPEDVAEAGELNKRMLNAQAAVLRQQLEFIERKIDLADSEDQPKEQVEEQQPRTLRPRRPMYRGGEKD